MCVRFVALILSIFITVLTAMPCTDAEPCSHKHNKIEQSNDNQHGDHDDESEHCTPFCVCACCGSLHVIIPMQLFQVYYKLMPNQLMSKIYLTPYKSIFKSVYEHSFWQPPKV